MSRRHFIRKMLAAIKSMALLSLLSHTSLSNAAGNSGSDRLHYKPLNGRSLRNIARKKHHHGSENFVNPLGPEHRGRFWQVMRWKLFHENRFKISLTEQRMVPVSIDWKPIRRHRGFSLTFVKHACLMIKDLDRHLLVDPVFSDIIWFIKDFTPLQFDLNHMPQPDHVLITHGHYDHLDTPSLGRLNPSTHIITPLGYKEIFQDLDLQHRTQLDWYDTYRDDNRTITLLPCNHWTMRNPLSGPNHSLWGSYLIKTASGYTIYISGDTAYFDGFEQLGKEFDIDLAVFNLGAYEPRWFMAQSHLNPREAVQAFKELNAKKLLIVHWGTFRLGDEPVYFPPIQIKQELKKDGLLDRLVDLKHGQTLYLDSKMTL
ncbi:MAG: MBL fold metallo-hydrolase [Desulfobacterales bacterium]|nr:MAG: MBL fold metallo-hydrolase [Desulfobacterales bacterium]